MDLGYAPNERLLLNLLRVKNIQPWYVVGESQITLTDVSIYVKDIDSLTPEQENAIKAWAMQRFSVGEDDVNLNEAG